MGRSGNSLEKINKSEIDGASSTHEKFIQNVIQISKCRPRDNIRTNPIEVAWDDVGWNSLVQVQ
jgi:hypothetical protein